MIYCIDRMPPFSKTQDCAGTSGECRVCLCWNKHVPYISCVHRYAAPLRILRVLARTEVFGPNWG